jgi:voltage-gated potassium channel
MLEKQKYRLYEILENSNESDPVSNSFNTLLVALIVLNVVAVMLDTVQGIHSDYSTFFADFEIFSVGVFSIEYVLRLWACTCNKVYGDPIKGRISYMLSPLAIVDLLAILPFYVPVLIPVDLRFLRILRLIRIFRLFKLARYSESMKTFANVLKDKKEDLLLALTLGTMLLIISSTLMFYAEHDAQPDKFSSIFDSLWWGVVTLATIGYGDVYPVTALGKIFGGLTAIAGIGMFALPAGILGSGFMEEIDKKRDKQKEAVICPHCGMNINESPVHEDQHLITEAPQIKRN